LSVTDEVVDEEVDGLSFVPWEEVPRPAVVDVVGLDVLVLFILLVIIYNLFN
jgi:hypothetical protein